MCLAAASTKICSGYALLCFSCDHTHVALIVLQRMSVTRRKLTFLRQVCACFCYLRCAHERTLLAVFVVQARHSRQLDRQGLVPAQCDSSSRASGLMLMFSRARAACRQDFIAGVQLPYMRDVYDNVVSATMCTSIRLELPPTHYPARGVARCRCCRCCCSATWLGDDDPAPGGRQRAADVAAEHVPRQRVHLRRRGAGLRHCPTSFSLISCCCCSSRALAPPSPPFAQASNVTNASMKTMSAVATIILPMSFITGLFGMNIK